MSSTPPTTSFRVLKVHDLEWRSGLTASGKPTGKIRRGMVLQDQAGRRVTVLALETPTPADLDRHELTVVLERTDPSPVQPDTLLTVVDPNQ
jgi:hypothetical protein